MDKPCAISRNKKVIEENRVVIEPEPEPEPESKRFNLRAFVKLTIKRYSTPLEVKRAAASLQT
ncbi:MAG: hypothetical protein ACLUKN_10755 [Bacilli bacterium]